MFVFHIQVQENLSVKKLTWGTLTQLDELQARKKNRRQERSARINIQVE